MGNDKEDLRKEGKGGVAKGRKLSRGRDEVEARDGKRLKVTQGDSR